MSTEMIEIEFAGLNQRQLYCLLNELSLLASGAVNGRIEQETFEVKDIAGLDINAIGRSSQAYIALQRMRLNEVQVRAPNIYTFSSDPNASSVEINFQLCDIEKHQWPMLVTNLEVFVGEICKRCGVAKYVAARDPVDDPLGRLFDNQSVGPAYIDEEGLHIP